MPNGWVTWGINPTGTWMIGAQTMIRFQQPNGTMTSKTDNLSSYGPAQPGEISMKVMDLDTVFWQDDNNLCNCGLAREHDHDQPCVASGSSVMGSILQTHGFQAANLNSKGTTDLL